jgi:hypothetical protein
LDGRLPLLGTPKALFPKPLSVQKRNQRLHVAECGQERGVLSMKEIPLTNGFFAQVSDEDCEFLSQWKWRARMDGNAWYAMRKQHVEYVNGKQIQKTILMHRLVLSRKLECEDFGLVDHIDGDGLNNCRENLRSATRKENGENRKNANKNNNSSGIRGVSFNKKAKKWVAHVSHNGRYIHVGSFSDIHAAEQAVIAARNTLFTHAN